MADNLDFDAAEFSRMSHREKIRICRQLADRAREIAEVCDGKHRSSYVTIAEQWDKLADDMEKQD